MKERIYQSVIVGLLVLFTVFFISSHNNYMKMLEINEDLNQVLDERNAIIKKWEKEYSDLEDKYMDLLIEYDHLKQTEFPEYEFNSDELYLLAQCVEAEAGNHDLGQQYVTQVILNRVHSTKFPNTIEEVIYQKNYNVPQFSVAYNGAIDIEVDLETLITVYRVIVHGTDLPEYVCYFYSEGVRDNWVNTLPIHETVGGLVFAYEDKEVY